MNGLSGPSVQRALVLEDLLSRQSVRHNRAAGGRTSGTGSPSARPGDRQFLPFAQILSTLQQLQQTDSTQYQQVTQQIAADLLSAKSTVSTANSAPSAELDQLSADFTKASQTGQLPDIQDLAMAFAGRKSYWANASATPASGDSTPKLNATDPYTTTATTNTTPRDLLRQILATMRTNLGIGDSLKPLSIISQALSRIGVASKA